MSSSLSIPSESISVASESSDLKRRADLVLVFFVLDLSDCGRVPLRNLKVDIMGDGGVLGRVGRRLDICGGGEAGWPVDFLAVCLVRHMLAFEIKG